MAVKEGKSVTTSQQPNERIYTTKDKSDWGDGPWQDEPDKVSWTDPATDLPCLIVRGGGGALCGYVAVAEGHPLYGKDYQDAGVDLDVHGGITFAASCDDEGPEESAICHIPEPGKPDSVWWLGFDCSHAWDIRPSSLAYERKHGFEPIPPLPGEVYRDLDYVRREVQRLAQQLVGSRP